MCRIKLSTSSPNLFLLCRSCATVAVVGTSLQTSNLYSLSFNKTIQIFLKLEDHRDPWNRDYSMSKHCLFRVTTPDKDIYKFFCLFSFVYNFAREVRLNSFCLLPLHKQYSLWKIISLLSRLIVCITRPRINS